MDDINKENLSVRIENLLVKAHEKGELGKLLTWMQMMQKPSVQDYITLIRKAHQKGIPSRQVDQTLIYMISQILERRAT